MNKLMTGTMIAMTAATLFAAGCKKEESKAAENRSTATQKAAPGGDHAAPAAAMPDEKTTATVHCMGANDCKGKSGCKTAKNACKGQNGCKGQGFAEATEADCEAKGGTPMAATM